ncbi:MAG: hypothetical protein HY900_20275 [Deltaproteobacteria bacterium]|nr:hypothetical protein [Deltaproteobacteria bacterium]
MRYIAAVLAALSLFVAADVLADRGEDGQGRGTLWHSHHGEVVELNGVVTRAPDGSGTVIVSERPIIVGDTTVIQEGRGPLKSLTTLKKGCSVAVRGVEQTGLLVAEEIIVKQC